MLLDEDPPGALAVCRIGLQQVERLGYRTYVTYLMGNASDAAVRVGEWDWALERTDDLVPTVTDPFDRYNLVQTAALIRVCRGVMTASDLDALEANARDISDPLTTANNVRNRAWLAFVEGDWATALERSRAAGETAPVIYGAAQAWVARAALWLGDVDALREAVGNLLTRAPSGRALAADHQSLAAGLLGLNGSTREAVEAYQHAIAAWRDLGCEFDLALSELDFLHVVGPDHAEARAAGEEARGIFARLGAAPFLARVDAVLQPAGIPSRYRGS
jgi:tetratricopeptide (TPR) repeat protein